MSLEIINWMVVMTTMSSGTSEVCQDFYLYVEGSKTVEFYNRYISNFYNSINFFIIRQIFMFD